MNNFELKPKL